MPTLWSPLIRPFLAVLAVLLCCQCKTLNHFKPTSPSEWPKTAAAEADQKDKEQDKADKEENGDFRLIAVNNTPFFSRLRSGLRSKAKPTRFLDKATRVELLKENKEKLFSQIRLTDGKKGWVPSRLVKEIEPNKGSEPEVPADAKEPKPDALPELEAPEKPSLPDEGMVPLDPSDLPPISVPDPSIRMPQAQPPIKPRVETPSPSVSE